MVSDLSGNTARPAIVLIVDDEPDILDGLTAFLELRLQNVHFATAEHGQEALEVLEQQPVDLIISDFRMPGMTGLEFLTEASRRWPDIPRLMMTAYADVQLAARAVNENKVAYFLLKPIDPDALVDAVGKTLWESRKARIQGEAFHRAIDLVREVADQGQ